MKPAFLASPRFRAIVPALAPPAAVIAVWLFGLKAEPAGVSAADLPPAPIQLTPASLDVPPRPRSPRSVEKAADERAQALRQSLSFPSPFFHRADENPTNIPERPRGLPPGVQLTTLMSTPSGAIAIINGHPYRTGDTIQDLATIDDIDVATRTVTITLSDGRIIQLSLTTPGVRPHR